MNDQARVERRENSRALDENFRREFRSQVEEQNRRVDWWNFASMALLALSVVVALGIVAVNWGGVRL